MNTPRDLNETVKLVEGLDRRMHAGRVDVRDVESIREALDEGVEKFGRLDFVVVNAAGITPVWDRLSNTMQAWHDFLDILLTGALNTLEATYPRLVEQGTGGSIAISSSTAGVEPMRTRDGHTLGLLGYSAAKAALVNLTQNYASFLSRYGIRANLVHPAGVVVPTIHSALCD